jgi:hypothetical protein
MFRSYIDNLGMAKHLCVKEEVIALKHVRGENFYGSCDVLERSNGGIGKYQQRDPIFHVLSAWASVRMT